MVASATFAMYLFEGSARAIVNRFVRLQEFSNSILLPGIISLFVIIVMIFCYIIEMIRRKLITKIETKLIIYLKKNLIKVKDIINDLENKLQELI